MQESASSQQIDVLLDKLKWARGRSDAPGLIPLPIPAGSPLLGNLPAAINASKTFGWLSSDAHMSGVEPVSSFTLTCAPLEIRTCGANTEVSLRLPFRFAGSVGAAYSSAKWTQGKRRSW